MRHGPSRTSRWRTGTIGVLLVALAVTPRTVAAAQALEPLEACEPPLRTLVTLLESKRRLTGTKEQYKGRPLGSDYSKCRILQEGRSWPQYAVFRSSDDITVVIEKHLTEGTDPLLYGPFQSAYRK